MNSKRWSYEDEAFMNDAVDAWEAANEVDNSFIKEVTGKEPDYSGEIEIERIVEFGDPSLPFGHTSGVFSSILNKFIDPNTGLPIEE